MQNLDRTHILSAISLLDNGRETEFSDSIKYDVLYLGRRYAPKELVGVAMELMTGKKFGPKSFKGGKDTECFKTLRRCGFTLVPKDKIDNESSLKEDLEEVLKLQLSYSSSNTPLMARRGELIRNHIPNHLWENIERIEPIFSQNGFECAIEGSDGVGRKNFSPWVRIFDHELSPSATEGWYVVLHFSSKGDIFYSTLGCGATKFKDGSLIDIPSADLLNQVSWARETAIESGVDLSRYSDPVVLNGNKLSSQFEKAIAFAKGYTLREFDESEFWQDLKDLCTLLTFLYEQERLGKAPLADSPQEEVQREIDQIARPGKTKSRGQGRGLSYPERVAVEMRAMEVTRSALSEKGFRNIKDVSLRESYDFSAEKDGLVWMVEVKGTTSMSAEVFLLTAPELKLHRANKGKTILALVKDIDLVADEGGGFKGEGGELDLSIPWDIDAWSFEPTSYRAVLNIKD